MDAKRKSLKAAPLRAKCLTMSEKDVAREIKRLDKKMLQAARSLEFERAATLRDQLKKLCASVFLSTLRMTTIAKRIEVYR